MCAGMIEAFIIQEHATAVDVTQSYSPTPFLYVA